MLVFCLCCPGWHSSDLGTIKVCVELVKPWVRETSRLPEWQEVWLEVETSTPHAHLSVNCRAFHRDAEKCRRVLEMRV